MKVKIKEIERKPRAEIRIQLKPKELKLLSSGFYWEASDSAYYGYARISMNAKSEEQFKVLRRLIQDLDAAVCQYEEE